VTPPDSGLRRLGRLNLPVVLLATLAYVLLALFLPGIVGGALLLVLAVALGALTARTWPVQAPRTRVVRVLILAVLVTIAVAKILG
jgi:hypothetical protein